MKSGKSINIVSKEVEELSEFWAELIINTKIRVKNGGKSKVRQC